MSAVLFYYYYCLWEEAGRQVAHEEVRCVVDTMEYTLLRLDSLEEDENVGARKENDETEFQP